MLYKEVFGLDISDASIEAIQLKDGRNKIKLVSFNRVELPPGIVEDGKILKKDLLADAISELLAKASPKPIKTPYAAVSLPESKIFTHIFRIPEALSGDQARNALKYEAEGIIPLAPDDIYWNFKVIAKSKESQEIFYVACQRKIIDDLLDVFGAIRIIPLVFESESMAIVRSLIDPNRLEKREGALIADIGARTTILTIFDRNGIRGNVNVPVAGNKFTEAIAEELKVSPKKAEELKRKCGLSSKKEEGRIMQILQSVMQPILGEIKTSVKYYERKTGRKISRIILAGGSAMMPEIDSYLSENLALPVSIAKPWADIKISSHEVSPILLANAIGLALRGLEKDTSDTGVNLLPMELPEILKKAKEGKISDWLGKIYLKLNKKFQLFNFKEWAITLHKYRLYLIAFFGTALIFLVVYFSKPLLEKIDLGGMLAPVSEFVGKIFSPVGRFLKRIFGPIAVVFPGIIGSIGDFFRSLPSFFGKMSGNVSSGAGQVSQSAASGTAGLSGTAGGWLRALGDYFSYVSGAIRHYLWLYCFRFLAEFFNWLKFMIFTMTDFL